MNKTSYFLQLALYFFGLMIILNIAAIFFGLHLRNIDGILLLFLIRNLASKYIIANGNKLDSRDYWSLFFGSFGIYLLYNLFTAIYLSYFVVLTQKTLILAMMLVLPLGMFATFLGLWGAKRFARKSIMLTPEKVYTVIDEGIANYLIDLLAKQKIEAYINKLNPLLSNAPIEGVDIILKDKSDFNKAIEIINTYFKEQENKEPWVCPKCHEEIEGSFSACWNCGYEE